MTMGKPLPDCSHFLGDRASAGRQLYESAGLYSEDGLIIAMK